MGRGLHTVAVHLGCCTRALAWYTVHGIRSLSTTGHPRQMQTQNLVATNVLLEQRYSPWVEARILLQSTLVVAQEHWHVRGIRSLSTTGHPRPRQMQMHNLAATNVLLEQQYSLWVEACILLQSTLVVAQEHCHGMLCARDQILVNYWPSKTDANAQLGSHKCAARAAIFTMGRGLHTVAVHLGCCTRALSWYAVCAGSDPCQLLAIQDRCKCTTWQPQMCC
jgi:hypothetical protein